MKATKKLPLFVISGASCVGKTAMCEVLFQRETQYIVLDSDLLWNDVYNTPEDDYRKYREIWLRLSSNISQIGMPVVICGCAVPKQYEQCKSRNNFSNIFYMALVSDDDVLEKRMRKGRDVRDENWIKSSIDFNNWLKDNADKVTPNIKLLDTLDLTPEEAALLADTWIQECVKKEELMNKLKN